jgi:cell division protein FtsL
MKMTRGGVLLVCVILFASVFGLFRVKYSVQYLHKDVQEMKRQIDQEKSTIHILNAEWTFLNQPKRLKELASRYLELKEVRAVQVKSVESFIVKLEKHKKANYNVVRVINKPKTKWKYKDKGLSITYKNGRRPFITIDGK